MVPPHLPAAGSRAHKAVPAAFLVNLLRLHDTGRLQFLGDHVGSSDPNVAKDPIVSLPTLTPPPALQKGRCLRWDNPLKVVHVLWPAPRLPDRPRCCAGRRMPAGPRPPLST
jgi:hypothetical protein